MNKFFCFVYLVQCILNLFFRRISEISLTRKVLPWLSCYIYDNLPNLECSWAKHIFLFWMISIKKKKNIAPCLLRCSGRRNLAFWLQEVLALLPWQFRRKLMSWKRAVSLEPFRGRLCIYQCRHEQKQHKTMMLSVEGNNCAACAAFTYLCARWPTTDH